jgi:ribonuclease P protein component
VLAARQRLRRRSDFAAAIRAGRRAGRGSVAVHLAEPPAGDPAARADQLPARAGFVVSRAVGRAVVRNKVRRRLRHLVRERMAQLPPGTTLVVRALPGAATASYRQLGQDLDHALAAARSRGRRPTREAS